MSPLGFRNCPPWEDPGLLLDLIDDLRRAGYNIGVSQYLAGRDLLLALAARGEILEDPVQMKRWLGPLLCTSPREQRRFPLQFDHWASRALGGAGGSRTGEAKREEAYLDLQEELERVEPGFSRWSWVVLALLGLILLLGWLLG